MKFDFRLFCISTVLLFFAWIAKMHFIFGGDYLFRIGSIGIIFSFILQIIRFSKDSELKSNNLTKQFTLNSICLLIVYLGMMLKVSHIMNSQIEKDFVLDFIGIPSIIISIIYSFINFEKIVDASKRNKLLFYKQILLPWILFVFSFLFYAIYSVILTKI
jgi:hypothetical protein